MCPRLRSRSQADQSSIPPKLWILLVGVDRYGDRNLPSLQYSALDCQGLGAALTEATASFARKEVIIHHDFVSERPDLAPVQQSIQQIVTAAGSQDTILFYFSGHGILETNSQQVVLCLADTNTTRLSTTGLPLNELLQQLSNCAASQQLVWLDACHSGGMTLRGTTSLAEPSSRLVEVLRHQAASSQGFYALLSCDRAQQSWEFPELGHGVFTYYLMRGLRGEAADDRGVIEADALYQYVYYQTLRYIDKTNQQIRLINQQKSSRGETQLQSEFPLQTPKRIVEGFGKVVLGKAVCDAKVPPRQALVVDGGIQGNSTTLALSQIWQSAGEFELRYFPQTNEPWSRVKQAIANLYSHPRQDSEISTVLLYLRGKIETSALGESWLVLQDTIRLSRSWLRNILKSSSATQQIVILDCYGDSVAEWIEDLRLAADRGQCLIAVNAPPCGRQQFAETVLETLQNADAEAGLAIAAWITQLQIALAGSNIVPQVWLSGTQGAIELLTPKNRAGSDRQPCDLGICPYMGLQAFDEADAEYFYGREELVQKLLNRLNHRSTLAVVGASGSGKSSLVRAGLIALLRQGRQIPGSDRWWVGCLRPGDKPLRALAKLLGDSNGGTQVKEQLQIEGLLYQGVAGFVRWLRTCSQPMVLLVIDQFEELFTLATANEREQFIELILGGLQYAGDRFKLVFTVRADFVASCLEIDPLASILQHDSVMVPPYLTEADYRRAALEPARQVGLQVESGLIEVLLQDLDRSAGDLPLLQFVLQQLWEGREAGKLTLKAYQELDGIKGALETQAQAVYDRLDPQAQACARWIFLNLTQLGEGTEDTRRRITKADLTVAKYPEALVDRTLRILTEAKLLVVNLDNGSNIGQSRSAAGPPEDDELLAAMRQEATVEVVHEILIRHWSSLRWWLEENRSRLRSQRQIEQAAVLWQQKERQDDFLLRGVRLAEAEEIFIQYTDELSNLATEYVAVCIDARDAEQRETQKRLRKSQLTAVVMGILGIAATAVGLNAYRQQLMTQLENVNSLTAVAEAQLLSNQQLESLTTSIKAAKQLQQIPSWSKKLMGTANLEIAVKATATLQQSIYGTQELNRLEGHSQRVNSLSISDNGEIYATASDDNTVKIWQADGTLLETLTAEPARVISISTANSDRNSEQVINPVHASQAKSISTERGKYFIAPQNETIVQLRSLGDRLINSYAHSEPVTKIDISPDEQLLATATADGRVNIWSHDGILQQILGGHVGAVTDVQFVPNVAGDRYQLVSTGVDKTVRIWQVFNRSGDREGIYSIAVSPTSNDYAVANWNNQIEIWRNYDDGTQKLVRALPGHASTISQIKYSPDGRLIASASWDKTIKLWDNASGKLVSTLKSDRDGVNSIAFSPDGRTLISGGEDSTVRLWDITDRPKLIKILSEHEDSVKTVTVSPDGELMASASYDNQIKLWSASGQLKQTIEAHNLAITSLSFTPDGQTLASASWDNTIKLWSIQDAGASSNLIHTLTGHQDGVTDLSFNSAGTVLASASGDRQMKLWNAQTGELIKNLRGHTSQINSLAFARDDRFLISGEEQQGLYWWNLDLDHLLARGCARLVDYLATNPNVKPDERQLCQ